MYVSQTYGKCNILILVICNLNKKHNIFKYCF